MNKIENNNEIDKIIWAITKNHLEIPIYNIWHDVILTAYQNKTSKNNELLASLTAIRKINQGKNEAIDALCDTEDSQ